ncbi:RPS12 [Symbiodinium sp. CCMP2592]|nr:RPS12 [Symbiodinium sp. CCMP2592]
MRLRDRQGGCASTIGPRPGGWPSGASFCAYAMDWQEKDLTDWARESLQEILLDALKDPSSQKDGRESSAVRAPRTPWSFLEVQVLRVEVSGFASLCGRKGQVSVDADLDLGLQLEVVKATRFYDAVPQRWPAVLRVPGFQPGTRPELQVHFDDPQSEVAGEVTWFLQEGLGARLLQHKLARWEALTRRRFGEEVAASSEGSAIWLSADAILRASQKRARKPPLQDASKTTRARAAPTAGPQRPRRPAAAASPAQRLHEAVRSRNYGEAFLADPSLLNARCPSSEEGLSLLHSAVLSNSPDMLSLCLLQARAELAPRDLLGRTPLFMALKKGSLEMSKCLLEAGAFEAEEGSLVEKLSQCLDLRSAPELFELVDAKERPQRQGRAMLRALNQRDARTAEAALEAGADPSVAEGGEQALHLLTKWRQEPVVRLEVQKLARKLVQARADVNAGNSRAETPLLFAAHRGDSSLIQLLLELRADPAAANEEGSTALMFAAHGGHEEVCKMLLEAYASPGARNSHGLTAEEMATKRGFRKLGALLAAHVLAPATPLRVRPSRHRLAGTAGTGEGHPWGPSSFSRALCRCGASTTAGSAGSAKRKPSAGSLRGREGRLCLRWDRIVEDLERRGEVEDRREVLAKQPEYVWKNGGTPLPSRLGERLSVGAVRREKQVMAELDDEEVVAPEAEPEEEVTDLMGAVRGVLKKSLMVDGAIRGLHEVAKHIEACKAQVVFLSESCNEATYKKLIQGLCVEKNVPVIDVPDNKSLGEWAGLCKIDKDGMPRKVVGASCVAIIDFGEEGEAYNFMMKHLGKLGERLSVGAVRREKQVMAELDDEEVVAPEAEPEEEVTDLMGAVRGVLKKSLMVDGAIRGLHEVAKHIEACKAQVVFLSESCNEATYKKLIQGLCVEKNVPVIDVPDNKSLGEWAGLCKIDKDGMPRKVVGASCVAIIDFGEEGEAYNFMMKHLGK